MVSFQNIEQTPPYRYWTEVPKHPGLISTQMEWVERGSPVTLEETLPTVMELDAEDDPKPRGKLEYVREQLRVKRWPKRHGKRDSPFRMMKREVCLRGSAEWTTTCSAQREKHTC